MSEWIWFDHHSKTPPSPSFAEQFAQDLMAHWEQGPVGPTQEQLSRLLGPGAWTLCANIEEAHFRLHYFHYNHFMRTSGRSHVLIPATEAATIACTLTELEGCEIDSKRVAVNANGQVTKEHLESMLQARSSLFSLSWADPLTGVIQPVHDLIDVCRAHDVSVHLDISTALGKLSPLGLEADYLSIDAGLLQAPLPFGAILAKESLTKSPNSYPLLHSLELVLADAQTHLDTYALQVGHLRTILEVKLQEIGALVFFQQAERLPNTCVFAFTGIHGQGILAECRRQGFIATVGEGRLAHILHCCNVEPTLTHCAVSIALSIHTTHEDIERMVSALKGAVKKLQARPVPFNAKEAQEKNMRYVTGTLQSSDCGKELTMHLLVDEEDGVIADCDIEAFGPPSLVNAAQAAADLLLRKNYMQAKRLSAELICQKLKTKTSPHLNFVLDVIDEATEKCLDIPIEDVYMAPPDMEGGEQSVYPGWETLTPEQKKSVISQVIEKEIQPYIELDAGGVEVIKVEENRVLIAYSGNCTSCFSATGATLDAIGNILRHKIYPDLMVTPDMSLLQLS